MHHSALRDFFFAHEPSTTLNDTVDGPAKSEAPVEDGGKHPIIYRVSTIQDIQGGGAGLRNHRISWFPDSEADH